MSLKHILDCIRDDLDSHQIVVDFRITPEGVEVTGDYASVLLAKKELRQHAIKIAWE